MADNTELDKLKKLDNLRKVDFEGCPCFLHNRHRWVLPILHLAQEKGLLPKPCTMVMFDAHDDAAPPSCMDKITSLRKSEFNLADLISLCQLQNKSRPLHDDWVKTGMELDLIGDVVIFGLDGRVTNSPGYESPPWYLDHMEIEHGLWRLFSFPGAELGDQGDLSDIVRCNELSNLWNILKWHPSRRFEPCRNDIRILLDIDLDCFVARWKEYILPWTREIYENEFDHKGKVFFQELVHRAGLITIAREPSCCGDEEKSDRIFEDINHFLFDNKLSLSIDNG